MKSIFLGEGLGEAIVQGVLNCIIPIFSRMANEKSRAMTIVVENNNEFGLNTLKMDLDWKIHYFQISYSQCALYFPKNKADDYLYVQLMK